MAVARSAVVCSVKERTSVERRRGVRARWARMKSRLLARKMVRAMSDFAHRYAG